MKDEAILSMLHRVPNACFFTRDLGFYRKAAGHPRYAIVCLAVQSYETASFVRRFLRHPDLATHADRRGRVFRLSHRDIRFLEGRGSNEHSLPWGR